VSKDDDGRLHVETPRLHSLAFDSLQKLVECEDVKKVTILMTLILLFPQSHHFFLLSFSQSLGLLAYNQSCDLVDFSRESYRGM
jgi:hypothetical protein